MSSTSTKTTFRKKSKKMASKAYVKKQIHKAADLGFLDTAVNLTSTIFTHTPVQLSAIAQWRPKIELGL